MNNADLELSILQAIATAEHEARITLDPQQRAIFRMGFVFGADWQQKRVLQVMSQAKEGQS